MLEMGKEEAEEGHARWLALFEQGSVAGAEISSVRPLSKQEQGRARRSKDEQARARTSKQAQARGRRGQNLEGAHSGAR